MPDWDSAFVPANKIEGYLLNDGHAVGKHKAAFFDALGFSGADADVLETELIRIARQNPVRDESTSHFGTKYVIGCMLRAHSGESTPVRTIWIVDSDNPGPRLVTAYPL